MLPGGVCMNVDWSKAACIGTDPEAFFPEMTKDGYSADIHLVKRICSGCPIKNECYEYGLGEVHGIWGGVTPKQRMHHRTQLGVKVRTPKFNDAWIERNRAS